MHSITFIAPYHRDLFASEGNPILHIDIVVSRTGAAPRRGGAPACLRLCWRISVRRRFWRLRQPALASFKNNWILTCSALVVLISFWIETLRSDGPRAARAWRCARHVPTATCQTNPVLRWTAGGPGVVMHAARGRQQHAKHTLCSDKLFSHSKSLAAIGSHWQSLTSV